MKGGWRFIPGGMVQGFGPSEIQTATAAEPFLLDGVLAIRVSVDSEYYLDDDSSNKAIMLSGSVTVSIPGVTSYTFTEGTTLEVLRVAE